MHDVWQRLLMPQRLGVDTVSLWNWQRTVFQQDFDRIVFCAAFRRLQDKTQVFPLARSDYVRTRLTHSLEVSSVARSMGTMVGAELIAKHQLHEMVAYDFGAILAASALAHDIGNPPFGHAGEEAIGRFFQESPLVGPALAKMTDKQKQDLCHFEGNAQGFRLVTKLQNADNVGGLQLSLPTLGAMLKYPCHSQYPSQTENASIAFKKFNYFQAEAPLFEKLCQSLGLIQREEGVYYRHPFSYLLEAADDICYSLIDIEDAYRLQILNAVDVRNFYLSIIRCTHDVPDKLSRIRREKDQMEYLRAYTIGLLVEQVAQAFLQYEDKILNGQLAQPLLECIPAAAPLAELRQFSYDHVYVSSPVLEVGIAGFEVIHRLLSAFAAALEIEVNGSGHKQSRMLVNLLPAQFLGDNRQPETDPYLRLLKLTDFISGMTDTYAVHVFKTISGINLPG